MAFPFRSLLFATALGFVAGCASPSSRIEKKQSAFNTWPADVQEKVRAGKIEVGFNQEMVAVALGQPDRTATRTTAQGTAEVWIYFDRGPKFSIGLGVGSSSRHSAYGGGVVVGDNGFRDDEFMRVIFNAGRVVAIEMRR
ncbi:MAG: hypothetical protein JWM32_506 [Verrucomicrobia bacterium]|nr:hypothetical protein [Verrucomicrobiota bacterium]